MAENPTQQGERKDQPQKAPSNTSSSVDSDNKKAAELGSLDDIVQSARLDELEEDPRIRFGPPRIQTAEDAREAYLRQEITLDQLNQVEGNFGRGGLVTFATPSALEKGDEVFERDLPEYMKVIPGIDHLNVDQRKAQADAKTEVREAADEAAKEVRAEAKPQVDLAVLQNQAAADAAKEKEEELKDELAGKVEG